MKGEKMKNFFMYLLDAVQYSRQDKVHQEIARHLWASEFRHESYEYILSMVKAGKVDQLGARMTK